MQISFQFTRGHFLISRASGNAQIMCSCTCAQSHDWADMYSRNRSQVKIYLWMGHAMFNSICKIDNLKGIESSVAIGCFLRKLFVKNWRGSSDPLPFGARVKPKHCKMQNSLIMQHSCLMRYTKKCSHYALHLFDYPEWVKPPASEPFLYNYVILPVAISSKVIIGPF